MVEVRQAKNYAGLLDVPSTLAVKRFEDLVIALPAIADQRRVAALLDRAEQSSGVLASLIKRAEELARVTQVNLASRTDRNPIGTGWVQTQLGDVVALSDSQLTVEHSAEYRAEYRIAGVYSFGKGLIDRGLISGSQTSYKLLTRLHEGNIVVSKLNGWEGAVAVVDRRFRGSHVSGEFPTFVIDETRMLPGFFAA